MRLVPKLALALLAGVFAVVAAFTAHRVRGEIRTFDEDVRRDQRVVGVTAAAALANYRSREDGIRLAKRVDASRENINISFVSLADNPDPRLRPVADIASKSMLARGAWVQQVTHLDKPSGTGDYLITYVSAPVADEARGAIQLVQSLAPRAAYISRGVWSVFISSVALVLVCGVIVSFIGAKMVGQPVSELIVIARRIGEGHFRVEAPVTRKDEFGELARALRSMSSELELAQQRMTDETEARIRAIEQLRHAERLATLGQLASVLAHEVGTPLNVIAGHAKMIATGRVLGTGTVESGAAIGAQCDRVTTIVRRILDYARRGPPRRASIEASDVMRLACGLLTGLADQRKVKLSFEPASHGELRLFADPDQLQQALTNLALNAIQASEAGQEVKLRTARATSGAYVAFTVEDQGVGIGSEARERIFEPFFSTKPAGEGTGLGLSVVRDIVEEHGGVVEVSSEPGVGSKFKILLPVGGE